MCVYTHVLSCSVVSDSLQYTSQAPLSMGILQARILEWVTMPSSRGSSQSTDRTQVALEANSLPSEPPGKPMHAGVGSLSLCQGIFPGDLPNPGIKPSPASQAHSFTSRATREAPCTCIGMICFYYVLNV